MATYTVKADTLADGASLGKTAPRKFARDSNGNLFAVYHRNDGTRNQIYISKSGDGGENWTEYKVTDDTEAHESPSIAIDSNDYIYIVCIAIAGYNTYDIWQIVKSTTGGVSWGSPADINAQEKDHQYPVIAIDSNDYIHIVCNIAYPLYDGIIYTKSEDGGSNWDANTAIAGQNYLDQFQVAIAIDSNDYIHLAFIGDVGVTIKALRYKKYTDSWQATENLAVAAEPRLRPSIAIDSNDYIHIVWEVTIGVYHQIQYIKYTDSWQAIELITTGNYQHYFPTISVDDDNKIYVVFYGYHAGSTTYRQIGYNYYTDSWQGVTWLTSGSTHNRFPNTIFARWPIDGSAKVNIPDTGFAFIWVSDDDIKIYLSADLTWQTAGPIIKTFEDTFTGTDGLLANKNIIFLDSMLGTDDWVLPEIIQRIFSDVFTGSDNFLRDLTALFEDTFTGADIIKVDKMVIFSDTFSGVDVFLIDKEAIFTDVFSAIEKFYASYPYPRDLKRKIIIIRDIK